jgi:alkaline phosphatase D
MKNSLTILSIVFFSITAFSQNEVKFMLSGGLTPTTVELRAKLTDTSNNVRAVISKTNPLTAPFIYSNVSAATLANNLVTPLSVSGLTPSTKYYYAIESKSVLDDSGDDIGTFTTPAAGPQSFSFVVGSCNQNPATTTYKDYTKYNALFYAMIGDLHYKDPCDPQISYHRDPLENYVFNQPFQRDAFRDLPVAYVWDDHDYCGNDDVGDQLSGTANARQTYRDYIPHYPLAAGSGNQPIYQSFEIGRVKFIFSDLRSPVVVGSTAMGTAQKAWFKQQVLDARNRNLMIAWASSYSWYGFLADNWGGFTDERTELTEFFRDSSIANMFIMNGDAHMSAIDNGVNGDFTTAKNLPYRYPLIHAGPIDNTCSFKGGTYSEGTFYTWFQKRQQYGVVSVNDNGGDSICVTMDLYRIENSVTSKLGSYSFCRKLGAVQTSITELGENSFELFPNPSNGIFNIRFKESEQAAIDVFSAEGKLVKHVEVDDAAYHPIDLSEQAKGVYIAKVKTSKGSFAKRLVINR